MIRGILTLGTFISVIFFPWPLTVLLALVSSLGEPLVPLAAGLFVDTLYYSPQASLAPFFTLLGALATGGAFFVRSRMRTGTIR
ncbi:hypothetical protein A3A36_02480 [Candidatus Kaiserbacteria bacterium RIFCSPLOWO2_01_FULL_52_12b]|uniref:Uncharacterized protein n=1 Tax=Candidatus Kaiserbacteria bacterium RIFCSPLOWO2_01_FULL_52_12b TaxID=1798509 RepID=A0A1F6EWA9_9BACT|nr:MAG: hypothetical protein A3A36_02480 [Candidatus Kaiserbacteria bacterium RIFCSPLOWO2_01_FULL_52_12b]